MKKLLFIALSALALFGCEDNPKTVYVEPTPPPVIIETYDDDYSIQEVDNFYVMCLVTNGIDQDDYCEETCADIFDYNSCDDVEDKYEELYGIGSDEPDSLFISSYKSEYKPSKTSKWYKYGSKSCSAYPPTSSIEKGKSFKQNNKCVQKYYKNVTYKNGSSSKQFKTEILSSKSSMAVGTKVIVKDKTAKKYSSNLIQSDKLKTKKEEEDKKDVATTVPAKALVVGGAASPTTKYSSNLLSSEKLKPKKEETKEDVATTVPTEALVVGGAAAVATTKYSSNLLSSDKMKPKPVTVTSTGAWKNSGAPYSCGSWSPSTSSKKKNQSFKQYASCKQKLTQTIKYSDGTTKTNSKVSSVKSSRSARGTKITYSSSSSSSKKKYK